MEALEVCNLGIPDLVTSIFSADWSDDNNLSIITDRGVHIFVSTKFIYS